MLVVHPSGATLGATVEGIDLGTRLAQEDFAAIVRALARHGVLCFPRQTLDAPALKAFSAHFGTLEVNVAGRFQEPGLPEVMILSNIVENGHPIGLADAGQDWHTDMSYSGIVAYANVLHALRVPRRDGRVLGATLFANMYAAYDDLPSAIKERLRSTRVVHDFAKFWDRMRARPGSTRPPLSAAQRLQKPPVSHAAILRHPISGRELLYANPGYAVRIEGMEAAESDALLAYLFEHQVKPQYRYAHHWNEGDVLMWDDLVTLHHAVADYGSEEPRLIRRCQVMADRLFTPGFVPACPTAGSAAVVGAT